MEFRSHLSTEGIRALTNAAIQGNVIDIDRRLLMEGILRSYVVGLTRDNQPLQQFQLDLNDMNGVEQLIDGDVPLVQFLKNIADQLAFRGRVESSLFADTANRIGNQSRGVPSMPDPKRLPEIEKNEAISGGGGLTDFGFLASGARVGKSVALLLVPRFEGGQAIQNQKGGPWLMRGTAWVIGPQLLLTNHHVVNARRSEEASASIEDFQRQGQQSEAQFDFDDAKSDAAKFRVEAVVSSSKDLDYALLRLPKDFNRDAIALSKKRVEISNTTFLPMNIIQHPGGRYKQVAFRNNLASGADDNIVRYMTDTDSGSSGSPVCDDSWRVVALHRGARRVEGVNFQGQSTAFMNFGTQIQSILEHLKTTNLSTYNSILAGQPL